MRVLVAEDDPVSRALVRRLLEKAGHAVLEADDGAAALELVERERPDMVITDWMMPGLDGVELCRRLRTVGPGEPYVYVIVLTVRQAKEDVRRGLDAGADDYIVKPFDPTELMARLRVGERILRLESVLRQRNEQLEHSLQTIRQLKSLLPICVFCRKVRNDDNYWQQIEAYIHEQTGTDFSHGICPECLKKHYPEYSDAISKEHQNQEKEPDEKEGGG